ncbi:MAG: MFS transporter [Chloroflexota bacterium]
MTEHQSIATTTLTPWQLIIITASRLVINVAYRILYPLLPFLSGFLNVSLQTISILVTVQVITALASPLGGILIDTRGERNIMAGGVVLFCIGTALCAFSSTFALFLIGYAFVGLSVTLYQPAAQTYLSKRTSYERRGFALGLFETSWAGSAFLGIAPLMLLVERTQNPTPVFGILFIAGIVALIAMFVAIPTTPQQPTTTLPTTSSQMPWHTTLRLPYVLAFVGLLVLALGAVDLIFVVYGTWLKTSFSATEGQLGQVFALLGVAELIGALASAFLVDRFGKKRTVVFGFIATAIMLAVLPLSDGNWFAFLLLFFLFGICFEFAIVSSFPLGSGLVPSARGFILALGAAAIGGGRAIGSLIAEPLWRSYGISANGLVGAAMTLIGVALCLWFIQNTSEEQQHTHQLGEKSVQR